MLDDETRGRVIRKNGDVLPTILLDGVVAGNVVVAAEEETSPRSRRRRS